MAVWRPLEAWKRGRPERRQMSYAGALAGLWGSDKGAIVFTAGQLHPHRHELTLPMSLLLEHTGQGHRRPA